jgi:endonuclease III
MQFGNKLMPRQLRMAGIADPPTAHHTLNIALRVILPTQTSNVQYNCHWKKLMHRVNTVVRVMYHTNPIPGNNLSLP